MQYERVVKRNLPPFTAVQLNLLSQNLLAPEVLAGHRMDLNRPFGNGRDGDGANNDNQGAIDDADENDVNGVVDDPLEVDVFVGNGMDDNADGVVDDPNEPDVTSRRQRFARDLYVLMMLLVDEDYRVERDPSCANDLLLLHQIKDQTGGTAEEAELELARKLTARRIAQWAINCTDFRDADAIMTRLNMTTIHLMGGMLTRIQALTRDHQGAWYGGQSGRSS